MHWTGRLAHTHLAHHFPSLWKTFPKSSLKQPTQSSLMTYFHPAAKHWASSQVFSTHNAPARCQRAASSPYTHACMYIMRIYIGETCTGRNSQPNQPAARPALRAHSQGLTSPQGPSGRAPPGGSGSGRWPPASPSLPPARGTAGTPGTPVLCSFPPGSVRASRCSRSPQPWQRGPGHAPGGAGDAGEMAAAAPWGDGDSPAANPLASHRPWLVTRGDGGCRAFPLRAGEGKTLLRGFEGCEATSCCYSSHSCLSAMQENPESSDLAQLL